MEDHPEVGFETEDNFFTMTYAGKVISGNVGMSDNVFRNQIANITQLG